MSCILQEKIFSNLHCEIVGADRSPANAGSAWRLKSGTIFLLYDQIGFIGGGGGGLGALGEMGESGVWLREVGRVVLVALVTEDVGEAIWGIEEIRMIGRGDSPDVTLQLLLFL